jgi:hypothetical protein
VPIIHARAPRLNVFQRGLTHKMAAANYHDHIIEDEEDLIKAGFTRWRVPVNGKPAPKLILENETNRRLMTYIDFDRTDLDNSAKLLREKLEYEQIVESELGKEYVDLLVTNFYNLGKELRGDPDGVFFKNGNGNGKVNDKWKEQEERIENVLMDIYHFKTMSDTKEIYYYDESKGIYVSGAEIIIESQAESMTEGKVSTTIVNEAMNHIIRRTYTNRTDFDTNQLAQYGYIRANGAFP